MRQYAIRVLDLKQCKTSIGYTVSTPIQSRNHSPRFSEERNEGSEIIQTGSQKSWLILTAHVLQIFDTFRSKLANAKRYSVGICLLRKEVLFETAKMSVTEAKFIWNIADKKHNTPNRFEVALLTRSDRKRMIYRPWNSAKDRICRKARLDLLSSCFSNKNFILSVRIL